MSKSPADTRPDLGEEHAPWHHRGHRIFAQPLLDRSMPRVELNKLATENGVGNPPRVLKRLAGAKVLNQPGKQRSLVRLVQAEHPRLRDALAAAGRVESNLGDTDATETASEPQGVSDEAVARSAREAGELAHGDTLLEVSVTPDVIGAFAEALERASTAFDTLWGSHNPAEGRWLLVADADVDVAALHHELLGSGAACRLWQLTRPMDAGELISHSRRLRDAAA